MAHDLVCWRCGASLVALSLPLRRLDECPDCRAELHVCRMCTAWDPRLARQCRQEDAEEVRKKDAANFCDWFRPRPAAFDAALADAGREARSQLAALFGGGPAASGGQASPAGPEDLFGSGRKR